MPDERPAVYREGDRWVFRASALGHSCTTALLAHMLEFDAVDHVPEKVQRGYDEGHDNEQRVIDMGLFNLPFKQIDPSDLLTGQVSHFTGYSDERQVRCEVPIGDRALIRMHLDGIAECYMESHQLNMPVTPGDLFVIEAKFLAPDYYKKWDKDRVGLSGLPGYRMQTTIQHMGTGLPVLFLVGKKRGGRGKDRGDLIGVEHVVIRPSAIEVAKVKARVMSVLNTYDRLVAAKARDWSELPACDVAMYPCPFFHMHDEGVNVRPAREVEVLDAMGDMAADLEVLHNKVQSYNKARFARDVAQETMDQLKPMIAELLRRIGRIGKRVRVNEWEIKYEEVDVPEREQTVRAHTRKTLTVEDWQQKQAEKAEKREQGSK